MKMKMKRLISLLLCLGMLAGLLPVFSLTSAATSVKGTVFSGSTGLTGDVDTSDTIQLPIKIYDYDNDGMLFEYSSSGYTAQTRTVGSGSVVSMPTATYGWDFTDSSVTAYSTTGNYTVSYETTADGDRYLHAVRGSGTGNYLTLNTLGAAAKANVRYMAIRYKTDSADSSCGIYWRNNVVGSASASYKTSLTLTRDGAWHTAVLDLRSGNTTNWDAITTVNYITTWPCSTANMNIDIAYATFFSTNAAATAYNTAADNHFNGVEGTTTQSWLAGNNLAYGLFLPSKWMSSSNSNYYVEDAIGTLYSSSTSASITRVASYNSAVNVSQFTGLGYQLYGSIYGGTTIGLLTGALDSQTKTPVYKEATVAYLADLLQKSLAITETNANGTYNYNYVMGKADATRYGSDANGKALDFAAWLRQHITGGLGTYAASSAKTLIGTWDTCKDNITTYYDAAYFMLNSIFVSGSYNTAKDTYNYLVLNKATGTDGQTGYIFDAGFGDNATAASANSSVAYDATKKTITNSSAAGKPYFYIDTNNNSTTLYPFLPITDNNNSSGQTNSPYFSDEGVSTTTEGQDSYVNRDYNYVLQSNGEFVYYADDDLFFNFEGDDDVYLFINGQLVMDIGGAHGITTASFNVNDYVSAAEANVAAGSTSTRDTALCLKDGETYTFDFYYMERHGYGANLRLFTNIRVTDPAITTEKEAYQGGTQINYGGVIDKDQSVEYAFTLANSGVDNLYNLTFTDKNLGVTLDCTNGLTVATGAAVTDSGGGLLTASDISAVYKNAAGESTTVTFADNSALIAFLTSPTTDYGLSKDCSVQIRGIYYTLTAAQIAALRFDNTVQTTAQTATGKLLQGSASMRVFVPSEPIYYQWSGHTLSVSTSALASDMLAAAENENNPLNGKVSGLTASSITSIVICTSSGKTYANPYVKVDASKNINIDYTSPGSYMAYANVTFNSTTVLVPLQVNVVSVSNSVLVLDYGLSADLSANSAISKNDTLTVPGTSTSNAIEGIASDTPSYADNSISFTAVSSGTVAKDNGTFTYTAASGDLSYAPSSFMDSADTVYMAVRVWAGDATGSAVGTVDINKEVEMYKSISVIPASIVYYEDDFPAINYNTNSTNTITSLGSGSSSVSQSNDQGEQYGHDNAYEDSNDVTMSGNSAKCITINQTGVVASFAFSGTGFELNSRTTANHSATVYLEVKDSSGTLVKRVFVVTEYDNDASASNNTNTEAIYQVPVAKVTGLTFGAYTVDIYGVPSMDFSTTPPTIIPSYFYIDGIRIYDPIGSSDGATLRENYTAGEDDATLKEVRDLIVTGAAAAVTVDSSSLTVGTATSTYTENRNDQYVGNLVTTVNDYLTVGPNNEVYLNGISLNQAIVFYVTEDSAATEHSLQVGVHLLDDQAYFGVEGAVTTGKLYLGVYQDGTAKWLSVNDNLTSGTEQYYKLNYSLCPYVEGKGYQVILYVSDGMISFTNLKYKGLNIATNTGDAATLEYQNGVLGTIETGENGATRWVPVDLSSRSYPAFNSIKEQMQATQMAVYSEEELSVQVQSTKAAFTDTVGKWFEQGAAALKEAGILKGYPDGSFAGDKTITRGEFAVMIVKAFGITKADGWTGTFTGLPSWAENSINSAASRGILSGYSATNFGASAPLTREQMMLIIYRIANYGKIKLDSSVTYPGFPDDAKISSWAKAAVTALVEAGIVSGTDKGLLDPKANCTRGQCAALIYRLLQAAGKL